MKEFTGKKVHVRLSQTLKETEEKRRWERNKRERETLASASLACRSRLVIMYRFVITIIRSCQAGDDVKYNAFSACLISTRRFHLVIAINIATNVKIRFSRFSLFRFEFHLIGGIFNERCLMNLMNIFARFVIALHIYFLNIYLK